MQPLRASDHEDHEEIDVSVPVSGHMNSPLVGFLSCEVTTSPL